MVSFLFWGILVIDQNVFGPRGDQFVRVGGEKNF